MWFSSVAKRDKRKLASVFQNVLAIRMSFGALSGFSVLRRSKSEELLSGDKINKKLSVADKEEIRVRIVDDHEQSPRNDFQ